MLENLDSPYPNDSEKRAFATEFGITLSQVSAVTLSMVFLASALTPSLHYLCDRSIPGSPMLENACGSH